MKIVHINTYNTGGAAKACLRLHSALLKQGVDSKVLLLYKTDYSIPEVYDFRDHNRGTMNFWSEKIRNRLQNDYNRLRIISKGDHMIPFSFSETVWDIAEHPLVQQADVVHLHWVAGFLDYHSFFTKCTKKIVWTLHDELPFSGGYHYEKDLDKEKYAALINENLEIKTNALKDAKVEIVCLSEYLKAISQKSPVFHSYTHHLIKNGMPEDVFHLQDKYGWRMKINFPLDKKILLYISDNMAYKRKGFDLFSDAVKKSDLDDFHIAIVGDPRGAEIPQQENIRFFGPIHDEKEMAALYASADLLACPSREDNQPNVITEALCCGLPVVAFRNSGVMEMIHEKNGLFAEAENGEALAAAIRNGLTTSDFNSETIAADAKKTYSDSTMAEKYIGVYQQ